MVLQNNNSIIRIVITSERAGTAVSAFSLILRKTAALKGIWEIFVLTKYGRYKIIFSLF